MSDETPPQTPDEWERWTEDYLQGDAPSSAPPDPAALAARVARDTRRMALAFAFDTSGAALVVAFWLWTIARDARAELVVMAGASFAFVAAWLG